MAYFLSNLASTWKVRVIKDVSFLLCFCSKATADAVCKAVTAGRGETAGEVEDISCPPKDKLYYDLFREKVHVATK